MSWFVGVVSAIFWGVVLLSVLVFVHEAGHFLSARAFGMRVTEFFLGMPCRVRLSHTSRTRGTEIGVTPILLGGYTRICGMDAEMPARAPDVLACLAAHGRLSVEEVARESGCDADEARACLAALTDWASVEPFFDEAAGEHKGQRDWPASFQTVRRDARLLTAYDRAHDFSLAGSTEAGEPHGLPQGGATALFEAERARTYQGRGIGARLVTLLAGPAINIVLGLVLLVGTICVGGVEVARDVNVVGGVQAGSMAEAAGISEGDAITSVDGDVTSNWTDLGSALSGAISAGQPFEVSVERDASTRTVTVDPAAFPDQQRFGITASTTLYHPGAGQALTIAWNYVSLTAGSVVQLLEPAHTSEVVSQSSSVIGISVMASQAAASGAVEFLFLMAAISLSLGFMNLIPIPPLDGGKVLIELIQLVSRRKVPTRVQTGLSYVGLALALLLFVFVVRQDLVRIIWGG